jgi:nucleoside-diphosphate-sugar epimerase
LEIVVALKSVLVTGANGFIGTHLVKYLSDNGVEVVAVVRKQSLLKESLRSVQQTHIVHCDMKNISALPQVIKDLGLQNPPEVFIHLAWDGVFANNNDSLHQQLANISNSVAAVKAAAQLDCSRFLFVGSAMQVSQVHLSSCDPMIVSQRNIYYSAKQMASVCTQLSAKETGLDFVEALVTNAYGPESRSGLVYSTLKSIKDNLPLQFSSGEQDYDFIYIDDVARALYALAMSGRPDNAYVVGSSTPKALRLYIEDIYALCAPDLTPNFDPEHKAIGLDLELLDFAKLNRETGFKPLTSFEDGIEKTFYTF